MKIVLKPLMAATAVGAMLASDAVTAKDKDREENKSPFKAYIGKLPDNDKLKVLTEHKVIATFQEVKFRRCVGLTGRCPDRCGSSGEFANFKITDYLHHKKLGKYGEDKYESYLAQISDFHRKPQGDPALLAHIESLEKGDQVVIEWKHLYGELRTGGSSPVRPLLLLKKIDQAEAKKLRD